MVNVTEKTPITEQVYNLPIIEIIAGDTFSKVLVEFEGVNATGWVTPLLDIVLPQSKTTLTKNGVIETTSPALFSWQFAATDFTNNLGDADAQVRLTDDTGRVKIQRFTLRIIASLA